MTALLTHEQWLAAGSPPDVDRLAEGLELRGCVFCGRQFSFPVSSVRMECPTCRAAPQRHRVNECMHDGQHWITRGDAPGTDRLPDGWRVTVYGFNDGMVFHAVVAWYGSPGSISGELVGNESTAIRLLCGPETPQKGGKQ